MLAKSVRALQSGRTRKESDDFTHAPSLEMADPGLSPPARARSRSNTKAKTPRNMPSSGSFTRSSSFTRLPQVSEVAAGAPQSGPAARRSRRGGVTRNMLTLVGIGVVGFALLRHSAAGRDNDKLRAQIAELQRKIDLMGDDGGGAARATASSPSSPFSAGGGGPAGGASAAPAEAGRFAAGGGGNDNAIKPGVGWGGAQYSGERAVADGTFAPNVYPGLAAIALMVLLMWVKYVGIVEMDAKLARVPIAELIEADNAEMQRGPGFPGIMAYETPGAVPEVKLLPSACFGERFELGDELGAGAFGVVHAGVERVTGRKVAIKIINVDRMDTAEEALALKREIDVLAANRHPHVVEFLEGFVTYKFGSSEPRKVQIVMELCEGGELFDVITAKHDAGEDLSEAQAAQVMRSLMDAVAFIHGHHCIHRDIKPENILLNDADDFSSVHLADFGVAAQFSAHEEMVARDIAGTLYFFAPEILRNEGAGPGVDVWACGIVLHLMLTGAHPFDRDVNGGECSTEQLIDNIVRQNGVLQAMTEGTAAAQLGIDIAAPRPGPSAGGAGGAGGTVAPAVAAPTLPLPSFLTPNACDLLRAMLQNDPAERISAKQCLEHAWLAGTTAAAVASGAAATAPLPTSQKTGLKTFHAKRKSQLGKIVDGGNGQGATAAAAVAAHAPGAAPAAAAA
eukprot:g699.t1